MRARHVLGDEPPHAAQRLAASLRDVSGLVHGRGRARTSSSVTRPGAGAATDVEVDAELLREPPHERRRAHASLPGASASLWHWATADFGCGARDGSGTVVADHDEHRPDRNDLALRDEDPRDDARGRRRDLDRRLVGLDLDERLVLRDLLALGDEPARDLAFRQALAEVRQLELVGHA